MEAVSPTEGREEEVVSCPPGTELWFSPDDAPQSWRKWKTLATRKQAGDASGPAAHSSPNHPFNWPAWRRDAVLLAVGFNSFIAGALIPVLATGFKQVSETFGVDVQHVSFTTGIYMIGLGTGAVVWSPTASVFGRRPVYLAGAALVIASSAWAASSTTFLSLAFARLVQGFAASPGEFLVSVTISEIYQPHERAFRVGVYMLLLSTGKSLSPLFGAAVVQGLGWRWIMWIATMVSFVCFVILFFFGRETYWDHLSVNAVSEPTVSEARPAVNDVEVGKKDTVSIISVPSIASETPGVLYTDRLRTLPALSYSQTLKPWNGRMKQTSWFSLLYRPLLLLQCPPLLWSTVVYALCLGWPVVIADSIAELFQSPTTYAFTPLQTGLLYFGPLVGTILGSVCGGKVSDLLARFRVCRNNGLYEPELRLPMVIPAALAAAIGFAGFGWSIQNHDHWIAPAIFFAMAFFGCVLGATVAVTYCLDCHKAFANETLVVLNLLKNCHGLAFSLFIVDWLEISGPRNTYLVISGLHVAFLLMTLPMYVYGKRARVWSSKRTATLAVA